MANLQVGTKAIIVAERGNTANGFSVGETVLIAYNEISGSREQGRVAFTKLDGKITGYANPENLLPVQEVKKEAEGVVEVQLEGAKFKGTVTDVLAVIKGLQELTEVKPATAKQFEAVEIERVNPVPVPKEKLGDKIGIGTKIVITGNGHHGELHPHQFEIGDVVEVIGNVGNVQLDEVAVRAEDKYGDDWTVHQDDFKVYVPLTVKPEVGMLAFVKDGKGEKNCLHGFADGDIVTIERIEPIKVTKTNGHYGYAGLEDLELLF